MQALCLAALAQGRKEVQVALHAGVMNVINTQINRKNTILLVILPALIIICICLVFTLPTRFSCSSSCLKKSPSHCRVTQIVTPSGNQEIISLQLATPAPPQLQRCGVDSQMLCATAPEASLPPQIQMYCGDQGAELLRCSLGHLCAERVGNLPRGGFSLPCFLLGCSLRLPACLPCSVLHSSPFLCSCHA